MTAAAMISASMPLTLTPANNTIGCPVRPSNSAGITRLRRPDHGDDRAQHKPERDGCKHTDRDGIARQRPHHAEIDHRTEQRRAQRGRHDGERQAAACGHQGLEEEIGAEDHEVSVRHVQYARGAIDQHIAHAQQGIKARLDQDHDQQVHGALCLSKPVLPVSSSS